MSRSGVPKSLVESSEKSAEGIEQLIALNKQAGRQNIILIILTILMAISTLVMIFKA